VSANLNTLLKRLACLGVAAAALGSTFCTHRQEVVPGVAVNQLPGHATVGVDTSPKQDLRLVPAEAYMRTYLQLFGGLAPSAGKNGASPLDAQKIAKGSDGNQLFDTWDDYLSAIGLPDYRNDIPRGAQTNALMVATFERLGAALCDRAVEHDLGTRQKPGVAAKERVIFAFDDPPSSGLDAAGFAARFDVLHRTFLGYPAALAETDRIARFHAVFDEVQKRHADPKAPKSRFLPDQAAWATVCEGLIRHPEFQLY
jgi:hypothetical protein